MPLARTKYWDTRAYHQFLRARAKTPFAWGQHDCALFAADGILAVTGVDIAADFRGKYSDEAGAFAAIAEICALPAGAVPTVADAAEYCAKKNGLVEWTDKNSKPQPKFARRGDLVVFNAPTGSMVAGLVHLNGQVVAAGEKELYLFPISKVLRAWHYEAPHAPRGKSKGSGVNGQGSGIRGQGSASAPAAPSVP